MSITDEDLQKFKDFMLGRNKALLLSCQLDSYHYFMDVIIPRELKNKNIFYETYNEEKTVVYKYGFEYHNIEYLPPTNNNLEYIFYYLIPRRSEPFLV